MRRDKHQHTMIGLQEWTVAQQMTSQRTKTMIKKTSTKISIVNQEEMTPIQIKVHQQKTQRRLQKKSDTGNDQVDKLINVSLVELTDEIIPTGDELPEEAQEKEPEETAADPAGRLLRSGKNHSQTTTNEKGQLEPEHNLFQQTVGKEDRLKCGDDKALAVAGFSDAIRMKFGFGQQCIPHEGLKKSRDQGVKGTEMRIRQPHDRKCFRPIWVKDMTNEECR